jgi:hypothetical protein
MVFLHHSLAEKMVRNTKGDPTCVGMTKAERSLSNMASLGTRQMQHNRVTLITTFRGLTKTQGA